MNILLFPRAAGREGMPDFYSRGQRAGRECLHVRLETAARGENPGAGIRVFDLASQIKKKRSEKYR